ncbi:MAG: four-carbon acid sugar kinase family protein [Verrucomicrobia bacterium]|nr:four-carbon acid sugar kinase family protein [Verrucomicrobiota bacterium]
MNDLKLTWYGDDFTGSTDVMETLALAGLRAVLFLVPPETELLQARFSDVQALGVAGISRALPTDQLAGELEPVFAALARIGAPLFHYKMCSTFDSAPEVGSIGRTIELALRHFPARWVPLVVGAPRLRRFVAFANLFAGFGPEVFRLDRHPTMRAHPVTPMREADLRLHLAQQTAMPIRHVDLTSFGQHFRERVNQARWTTGGVTPSIVLFDTCTEEHLEQVGELLWNETGRQFVVGSSGVEHGLVSYLQRRGVLPPHKPAITVPEADRVLVVSGSAAPQTAAQIQHAQEKGFVTLPIAVENLLGRAGGKAELERLETAAEERLKAGRSVVVYSARGPVEGSLIGKDPQLRTLLGAWQGDLLARLIRRTDLRRVCVAGGDTSGMVSRQLGIRALEVAIPIAPGAPLCRVHADEPTLHGLEIALKGGQNGGTAYFEQVRKGQTEPQYGRELLEQNSLAGNAN